MAYSKREHAEPSSWKLEEKHTLTLGGWGGGSRTETCMIQAVVQKQCMKPETSFP